MSSRSRPTSDASRPNSRSGILTPASDHSLNRSNGHDHIQVASRKHRNDSEHGHVEATGKEKPSGPAHPMEELLKPSICIKCHPPNVLVKPRTLLPLMLLPRECIPLSSLDLSAPHADLPVGRFFESRIRIMELEGRLGSNILIARLHSSEAVYAIEREENGLYVLCRMGSWVNFEKLSQHAMVVCRQRLRFAVSQTTNVGAFQPPLITPHLHKANKRKRLAIEELQSVVRAKRPRSASLAVSPMLEQQSGSSQLPTPVEDDGRPCANVVSAAEPAPEPPGIHQGPSAIVAAGTLTNNDALVEQTTSDDIFGNIRSHYFEALYRSMGSLAYFAKGPLSRARAAFHLNCDYNLEMIDLIDFLKDFVMTTTALDKKYRDTIPEIVTTMKTFVEASDGGESKHNKRRARKMKLGRDSLYPTEDDHVRRWWTANKPELRDDEVVTSPEEVKYHISRLRTRETQLQMILILEIISLETMRPVEDALESQLPGLLAKTPPKAGIESSKKRRKHNFPVLVDLHADRLCIWQSTTLDSTKALADSQIKDASTINTARSTSDPLKDFCVDIIIPFFSSRLPELCESLNRKLGGPLLVSPPKLRAKKTSALTAKPASKPGTAAKRPALLKTTKSLDQILSREKRSVSRGPSRAIARLRSATVSTIPGIKRETSDPQSLASIPRRLSGLLKERPVNALARSASMSNIESQKAKKQALVEAELKDAISALKRPNRELAGKTLVQDAERRLFRGPTYISKARKTRQTQSPLDKVQVKATPVNNRYRDALAGESQAEETQLPQFVSEPEFIPSTGPRRGTTQMPTSPRVACTPLASRVQATPIPVSAIPGRLLEPAAAMAFVPTSSPLRPRQEPPRPAAQKSVSLKPLPFDFVPGSSPLQRRKTAPQLSVLAAPARVSSPGEGYLLETPVKAKPMPGLIISPPQRAGGAGGRLSIYQRLGWDDDVDEL